MKIGEAFYSSCFSLLNCMFQNEEGRRRIAWIAFGCVHYEVNNKSNQGSNNLVVDIIVLIHLKFQAQVR